MNEEWSRRIEELGPWFHNLHLPDGSMTAPHHFLGDFPSYKWKKLATFVPSDLHGARVLDIGCNAGYYSFELAQRGAQVTAIDVDAHYLKQAHWAAEILGFTKSIEFRKASVYDLLRESEQFDLVWFMGVLYHLRYPLLALDIVRRVCKHRLLFQTMTTPGEEVFPAAEDYALSDREVMNEAGWPRLCFIEHRIEHDPTNWWAPNHSAVLSLLRSAGFTSIERIAHEVYWCSIAESEPSCSYLSEVRDALQGR